MLVEFHRLKFTIVECFKQASSLFFSILEHRLEQVSVKEPVSKYGAVLPAREPLTSCHNLGASFVIPGWTTW